MKALTDLPEFARELATASMTWMDQFWYPDANLLALGFDDSGFQIASVRNSTWYALGLLLRDEEDDADRAVRVINAVLDTQYDAPGMIYHGTFPRWLGEPHPPADAVEWQDYDPNWRQFIGTTWALILDAYRERLPAELIRRLDASIQLAVVGEPPDRCPPSYTNIALLKAGLNTWAGHRYGNDDWAAYGETFGQAVYDLFQDHKAFNEYNSPTYYGTDFYALAFWKNHACSLRLSRLGREMEVDLWRDVARYYHAGLKNSCGPYSRSYGMDLMNYGALIGLAIWLGVGRDLAPFPRASGSFDHGHDFCFGPPLAFVGVEIPEDVLTDLTSFSGERRVHQIISTQPQRRATAWLSDSIMVGAESVQLDEESRRLFRGSGDQYHPVTMHWRTHDGRIGWMRLRHDGLVDARVEAGRLTVHGDVDPTSAQAEYMFELYVPDGLPANAITPERWRLPGQTVDVVTTLSSSKVSQHEDQLLVTYFVDTTQNAAHFEFRFR